MSRRVLILGAGVMQKPAIEIAKQLGLQTIVVDGNPQAPYAPLADRFEVIDLKDKEAIAAFGKSLKSDGGLDAVFTAGTDFSTTVAWVAEQLGLPGIPYEVALNASDKERMRRCFKNAGVPSPEFTIFTEPPGADISLPFGLPAVVKPVDNMGARGCRRVDTMSELSAAVAEALTYSRSGRVIVEEYMEGPEFSIDALVYNGTIIPCGVADRHIRFPPYFIEMGHTMPTEQPKAVVDQILSVFARGVAALGIQNGAAKGDVKLTPQGPMIGEIAARLSGGYMSGWTYPYASGVQPTAGALAIALGEAPPDCTPKRNWTSAERAFISIPGQVTAIYGVDTAAHIEGVCDVFFRVHEGDVVQFPENNVTKCGNIIAASSERQRAIQSAEAAVRSILIRLVAPHPLTEAFLHPQSGQNFPPDAFPLSPELRDIVRSIPDFDEKPVRQLLQDRSAHERSFTQPSIKEYLPIALLPCPALLEANRESNCLDYAGRSIRESIEIVRSLTGLALPVSSSSIDGQFVLGKRFWMALIRGGYQGAVYYIDSLGSS